MQAVTNPPNKKRRRLENDNHAALPRKSARLQRACTLKQYTEAVSETRTRRNRPKAVNSRTARIEEWLESSQLSLNSTPEANDLISEMSRKPTFTMPSPRDSSSVSSSVSRKERTAASVHDTDYYQSLEYRDVYIDHGSPPRELSTRAKRIVTKLRSSPELDDEAVQDIVSTSRRLAGSTEADIIEDLGSRLIPALRKLPDKRLTKVSDGMWTNSVPVPLAPVQMRDPLRLPIPKPDRAFGYSREALNNRQEAVLGLLVDDQFGRSFAMPATQLRFPFLAIEFKSQAASGTHYVATKQAAGAGAIAMNGSLDLISRGFGPQAFDYDEPQFFSVTMDHEMARVNVHWVSAALAGDTPGFRVARLSRHLLDEPDGVRSITRAIKNILDYGISTRLQSLCKALDAYHEKVVRDRAEAAAAAQRQTREASRTAMLDTDPALSDQARKKLSNVQPTPPDTAELNSRSIATPHTRATRSSSRRTPLDSMDKL